MKTRTLSVALALLASPTLVAQDAKADLEKLESAFQAAMDDFMDRRKALSQTEAYQAALKTRDREALQKLSASVAPIDYATFRATATAAAEKYSGTDDAIGFLVWIVTNGRDPDSASMAIEQLLDNHLASDKLAPLVVNNPYGITARFGLPKEVASMALNTLATDSPHAEIRANALYARSLAVTRDRKASDEQKAQAKEDLIAARKMADGTLLADRIDAPEFEANNLQIGMVAPDIVGEDLDGVGFKLSDYRGKVVVLDFWGDW